MKLNERKTLILQAIIQDYIQSAEPVGSRTLSKKYELGVSPATIRNEMSDLEELGYLKQPHTSSGRIPSDKGYRLYVDKLMETQKNAVLHNQQINTDIMRKFGEVEQLLEYSSKIISQLTNYTSIVLAPQIQENKIKHIQLIPIDSNSILAVIVTETGVIRNPILRIRERISPDTLEQISNFINTKVQGKTIKEIEKVLLTEIQYELRQYSDVIETLVPELANVIEAVNDYGLYLSGTTNIFNFPEFNDLFKAKAFLTMLEERQLLSSLITTANDNKLNISIGSENMHKEASECSLVTATYEIEGSVVGWLTVIGPTRMDYSNVVSSMIHLSGHINSLLTKRYK
ncbi:heat-inducible transcriptional repressor HrcA [Serpentinicella sp. ANB-PHB4]|uniref:heat-inducible transcriptional repressor HrcA n=1 Tax=Serpentinicella sp. ANB-PHB4 TaxID=3074076 RepID=UPI00285FDE91|nr:heat-inducible transcriptional repressor HrcA [Serpentinicella sp. ANB-PHB4]MDR5657968.1 heat-inducible transcriptional repressor HrcA [Serpentinicella sp. ANB-PHB4]